ncbi:methyltransferase domain-containing protein [Pseudomonas protegens]|uniref:methyltransferase domain-containing protein n=1 Tax=Pseudomonas chlororaphis group TaxID=136842 RepID=UPI0032084482
MTTSVWRHILRGIKSSIIAPPVGTGGTVSAEYCYSVYLRHMVIADQHGLATSPKTIVELGPGDSLGIGLMGMLTGAEQYYALDAVRHAKREENIRVFDELVKLLKSRSPIPSGGEFAEVLPTLDDYSFPNKILNEFKLAQTLAPERLSRLRLALESELTEGPIRYLAPMGRTNELRDNSVDMIISQAVMEHVDQLQDTYSECFRCLKHSGFMSHQIDLRCHDTAPEWNGHWKYSDLTWRLMRGGRPWFINRQPCSAHLGLLKQTGFSLRAEIKQPGNFGIAREQLASRFRLISESDFQTAGIFVLASKPA